MAEAVTRQAAAVSGASKLAVDVKGQKIEVAVRKNGRLLGRANATMNMDRTVRTVLGLTRRDQGEIPFAIDSKGALHTPEAGDRARLEALDARRLAAEAAASGPRRTGDWIIVAREDPSGIVFGIARPVGESLREIRRASVRNLSLGLLVIGLAFIGIVPISHRMTQHLSSLTAGVRQLSGGDFHTRVPVRSSDEFGTLARAFNQMAADLEQHEALVVEQERLRRELELSRLIQTEMLPRGPLRTGPAEIAGVSIPAREVGGDFFNYFVLPDGRLALLVGDVSGKGVSAALLMANVQATLRARMPHETDLAALADRLDRELDQNTPGAVYLTLFLGILEMDGRTLRYVNAGHNPQFVLREGGGIEPLSSTGLPIALYSGHGYREAHVELAPGDLLFFYTDGLVETESESGDMFGAERLQALLAQEHCGQHRHAAAARRIPRQHVPRQGRPLRRRNDDGIADQSLRRVKSELTLSVGADAVSLELTLAVGADAVADACRCRRRRRWRVAGDRGTSSAIPVELAFVPSGARPITSPCANRESGMELLRLAAMHLVRPHISGKSWNVRVKMPGEIIAAMRTAFVLLVVALVTIQAAAQTPPTRQAPTASRETYESVSLDADGNLRILTSDRRTVIVPKGGFPEAGEPFGKQTAFERPVISDDRRAVGAQAMFGNCCTSYRHSPAARDLFEWQDSSIRGRLGDLRLAFR